MKRLVDIKLNEMLKLEKSKKEETINSVLNKFFRYSNKNIEYEKIELLN